MSEVIGSTSNYEFIRALEAEASPDFISARKEGPVLDLYKIDLRRLPVEPRMKDLMRAIMRSPSPYDCSANRASIGDDTMGAMRQIHANAPRYLPGLGQDAATSASARGKLYHAYAQANKHHSADRGGGNVATGYVEYTAGDLKVYGWGGNRFRIVFDYLNSKLYFAPLHYASWEFKGNRLNIIDKPLAFSGNRNPFFWITEF